MRSLYVNGLLYLLEALPADLTSDEVRCIQDRLPEPVKCALPEPERPDRQPSYLHRILAAIIVYGFLLLQLLLPYAKTVLQNVYRYERSHRVTERLVATTLRTADRLGKSSVGFGSTVMSLSESRVGAAVSSATARWIEGIAGGIYEGFGQGMVILEGDRSNNTELQLQSS